MNKEVLYLGLDVHAENIAVAIAEAGRDGEVRSHGIISSGLHCAEKLLRKLGHPSQGTTRLLRGWGRLPEALTRVARG